MLNFRSHRRTAHRRAAAMLALALAGCSGGSGGSGPIPGANHAAGSSTNAAISSKIQHVIVVILENRSFDDLFDADTNLQSVTDPPVNVNSSLMGDSMGTMVALNADSLSASSFDENHSHQAFLADFDGGRDDGWTTGTEGAYGYVPGTEVAPYYSIASQFAISDNFFHGVTGPTFPSHLMIGAGTTFGIIDNPSDSAWGCDSAPGTTTGLYDPSAPGEELPTAGPFPCFDDLSIFDLMDRAGTTWRYYVAPEGDDITGELNIAGYFRHIRYGPDWNDDIATTDAEILTDLTSGSLRQVSFVIPNDASTDHAGYPSLGPTYIEQLVNVFGASQYINNTLMIVTWDDWGGWYDHVAPPKRANGTQLSFRKPILFIGGYVKHNYCSHVQTEDASIPKTIEEIFGLGSLGENDVGAAPFDDVIDVTQTPPAFTPITAVQGAAPVAGVPEPPTLGARRAHRKTYFRVIPADFMRPGADGRYNAEAQDYYGQRAADY